MSGAIELAERDLAPTGKVYDAEFAEDAIQRAELSRDFPVPPPGYAYVVTAQTVLLIRIRQARVDVTHELDTFGESRSSRRRFAPPDIDVELSGSVLHSVNRT